MNQVEKMPWEYTNGPMNQQNKHEEVLVNTLIESGRYT